MKQSIILGCTVLLGFSVLAAPSAAPSAAKVRPKGDAFQRRAAAMARQGGCFVQPNSQKGCIRIVNAQKEVSADELRRVEGALTKHDKFKIEFTEAELKGGCPVELARASKDAGVTVVVVSDEKSSPLLVSPDEHWAVVNVRSLGEGLTSSEAVAKFLPSRCRKQIIRAYVLACTGNGSQYLKNFFYATKVSDFDLYNEFVPMDAATHCRESLVRRGVTPTKFVTYRKGVVEGWAPAPTNDVQKAIWEEVHKLPTKPIKILPETKKVKD